MIPTVSFTTRLVRLIWLVMRRSKRVAVAAMWATGIDVIAQKSKDERRSQPSLAPVVPRSVSRKPGTVTHYTLWCILHVEKMHKSILNFTAMLQYFTPLHYFKKLISSGWARLSRWSFCSCPAQWMCIVTPTYNFSEQFGLPLLCLIGTVQQDQMCPSMNKSDCPCNCEVVQLCSARLFAKRSPFTSSRPSPQSSS